MILIVIPETRRKLVLPMALVLLELVGRHLLAILTKMQTILFRKGCYLREVFELYFDCLKSNEEDPLRHFPVMTLFASLGEKPAALEYPLSLYQERFFWFLCSFL